MLEPASLQKLLLGCRAGRSFAVGVIQVALPLMLKEADLDVQDIFAVLSAGIAGATAELLCLGRLSGRLGRLRTLALLTAGMGLAVAALVGVFHCSWVGTAGFVVVALLGGLSTQPNISAQAPLEHATLADTAVGAERTAVFAWYNTLSTAMISVGSLATGVHALWPFSSLSMDTLPGVQMMFASVVLLLVASAYLAVALRETPLRESFLHPEDLAVRHCRHFHRIVSLAALFAVDAWAGGMTMSSVMTYWLSTQFGCPESSIGILFCFCGLIGTASFPVAAWLSGHIGLINTMVFTHLPSNVLLILIPFMPNAGCIYVLFCVRAFLSQMDVPARETFMMSVVGAEERVASSAFITTARAVACVLGPISGGALWYLFGPVAPLVVSGALKSAYDLTLLVVFRAVPPVAERPSGEA
eukprot:CAMPEP_0194478520 /NCGR_PEP_ID=MMETSP0253-20130528/1940_1 /TAXON_ID=2966 /ORGANISM="Noctiluca scintillans" /LENGTH=414 /DNA_ID=CAMNT_0039317619 /DNA_START=252 /DNA_END=1496 /DNA_ORIENTATION=+